jgi:dihydropyrimidinase
MNAPLYIVHNACKEGIEAVIDAKWERHVVFAETCPQYLEFNSNVYKRPDGALFVCSPAVKGEESRAALREALKSGAIDTVATDHCPFPKAEKLRWGMGEAADFSKIPNGCGGVEFLYPYVLNLANRGEISMRRAVQLCAENPARIFGCADKGALAPGKDADIALYDPKQRYRIAAKDTLGAGDYSIYEGLEMTGRITQTYLRGKPVFENGKYVGDPGDGRYVKRESSGVNN